MHSSFYFSKKKNHPGELFRSLLTLHRNAAFNGHWCWWFCNFLRRIQECDTLYILLKRTLENLNQNCVLFDTS